MSTVLLERGVNNSADRRVRVGIFGGLFDRAKVLKAATQPLVEAGYEVCIFESKVLTRSGKRTLIEAERFIEEEQPDVIGGPSFGGLVALVAGFGKSPYRIVPISSPLHRPHGEEYTLQSRAITAAVQPLRYVRNEFYRRGIHQRLDKTDQEIVIVTGTEDEIVPKNLSRLEGYRPDMTHIQYVEHPTPPEDVRQGWAHTHNTRNIYGEPFFLDIVAQDPLRTAA